MSQQSLEEELSADVDKLSDDIDESDDESSVITDIDDIETGLDDDEDEDISILEGEEGIEETKENENPLPLPLPLPLVKKNELNKQLYVERDDDGDDGKYLEMNNEDEEEKDSDTEEDENYLMKFDKEVRENYIVNFHPESIIHNYSEIQSLIQVVRDKSGIIIDSLHRTVPFLTKYEQTRIIGQRTKQLNSGSKPFIKVDEDIIDGYVIALKELEQKKIPFIIRRPLPNGGSEYWKLEDLQIFN